MCDKLKLRHKADNSVFFSKKITFAHDYKGFRFKGSVISEIKKSIQTFCQIKIGQLLKNDRTRTSFVAR